MYSRHLLKALHRALKHFPVIFLNGPRQAGKSTIAGWLKSENAHSQYLTMDDLNTLTAAQSDPVGLVDAPKYLMILDETQRAPQLFLPIKASVDKNRKAGRFFLTGSANVLLLPHLADSLAGRMQIFTLYPLSADEINGTPSSLIDHLFDPKKHSLFFPHEPLVDDETTLAQRMVTGGYPEVQALEEDLRRAWFKGYVATLLQRDVRELANIDGLSQLPNLLALLATRTSSLLNASEVSRSCGLATTTLKRYLTLLQTFFLIHLLPAWSNHRGKRLIKSPKIHLLDTGLACYLLGLNEAGLTRDPSHMGRVCESFVMGELLKMSGWSYANPTLYHYRTTSGAEVDLVLEAHNKNLVGVEVKATHTIRKGDFNGLKSLAEDAGKHFVCGVVFYLGDRAHRMGERLYALPISMLWS